MGASRIPAWPRRVSQPAGPGPGLGPGPQGWGPPPQPGRSRNTVILIAAAVAALAIALTVVLVSVTKSGSGDGPPPVSNKPDITALTDSMLLTEADFPKADGGDYRLYSVSTAEEDSHGSDDGDCVNPAGQRGRGDQWGSAQIYGHSAQHAKAGFSAGLDLGHSKVDAQSWAAKCLPLRDGRNTITQIHVPGLPSGVVSAEATGDQAAAHVARYLAIGYVRGVKVLATVALSPDQSPEKGKADLVAIFNRQAAKLNAA